MKILIKGDTKSGKTDLLRGKYEKLIESGINSNEILFLVANRLESIKLKKKLGLTFSNENRIYSYFGFVQHELNKFWPLILKKSKKIKNLNISPIFMTFEASQCLMGKTVEFYRNHGYLNELNMSNEEISKKLLSNILDGSMSNLIYTKIGEKLSTYGEVNHVDLYTQMNVIIDRYMEKTLENGTFDYGTSIYLYNNFLLTDKFYLENLKKNTKYLLVDSGELASIAEIDFIDKIKGNLKGLIVAKNIDGPYGIYSYSRGYLEEVILNSDFKVVKLEKESNKIDIFLDELEEKIYEGTEIVGVSNIVLDIENEYKSENNKNIIKRVLRLLEDSVSPNEISVIVPQRDIVLEFALQKIGEEQNFKFKNIGRNEKVLDDPYTYILVISSILFYNFKEISLNFDEMKAFFSFILKLDPIRSALLTNYIGAKNRDKYMLVNIESKEVRERIGEKKIEKYDKIRRIFEEIPENIELYDFFEIIYINILENKESFVKDIKGARELIDSSKKFIETLENFNNIKDINYEFIKFLREGAKASETLIELDERLDGNYLSISTPYGYINSGRNTKYQIWTDIRNKNFISETKNILQNSWVLSKTWKGKRFSIEDEFEIEKLNMMGILKRLIKSNNGTIYVYGSKYSSGNHRQEGLLYHSLKRIKGD